MHISWLLATSGPGCLESKFLSNQYSESGLWLGALPRSLSLSAWPHLQIELLLFLECQVLECTEAPLHTKTLTPSFVNMLGFCVMQPKKAGLQRCGFCPRATHWKLWILRVAKRCQTKGIEHATSLSHLLSDSLLLYCFLCLGDQALLQCFYLAASDSTRCSSRPSAMFLHQSRVLDPYIASLVKIATNQRTTHNIGTKHAKKTCQKGVESSRRTTTCIGIKRIAVFA